MKFISLCVIVLCAVFSASLDKNADFDDIKSSVTPLKNFLTNLEQDESKSLKAAEQRLNKVNEISSQFELVMLDNRYVLKAKKAFKANETILQFDDQECISTSIMNAKHFNSPNDLKKLDSDINAFKELQTAVWQKGILALAYHLYNMKESKYQEWIQTIPTEIPSLIKDLSKDEIDLLQGDELYDEIIDYIKTLKGDFIALKERIDSEWTETQRKSFFNNNEFTIGDYYFTRQVLELCGFVRKSANDQSFFAIPAFMYIPMGKEFNPNIKTISIFMDRPTKSLHLTVRTDSDIPKGEIISINLYKKGEELQSFIALGKVKQQGSSICVDVKLLNQETLLGENEEIQKQKIMLIKSISGHEGIHCLTANKFSHSVFTHLQCIINMNSEQTAYCNDKALVKSSYISDEKQIKFQMQQFDELCEKPKWETNQLDFVIKELDEKTTFFENKMQKIEQYYQEQQLKKEDLLLLDYFKLKKSITLGLKEQIHSILTENNLKYEAKSDL